MRKDPAQPVPQSNADVISILGLVLLATLPYLNSLTGSFVYDDEQQILDNPYVHRFRYLGRIFGSTVWTFQGAQGVTNYYRPLMSFAYLVCYKLFGPIPFGFHVLNLTLHLGVVLLLYALTEQLFADRLISLVTASLFAVHPIHTESVTWIAGITDLELSFFFLLTFLLYLRLEKSGSPQTVTVWSYLPMLGAYVLALLSKEQALMLPLLAAPYEHFYRDDRGTTSLRQKISRYLPLVVLALCYVGFRLFWLGGFAPSVARPNLSWKEVILSAVALVGGYLWKLVWPVHLSAFYVFHESKHILDSQVLLGLLALLICVNLFGWLWSRAHLFSFAFLWMGATLAPVLNARWMPAGVFAERYLYLPSVGFCWLVACLGVWLWRSKPSASAPRRRPIRQQAVPFALIVIVVLYSARTVRRNRDWRSDQALYTRTLEEQPDAQLIRTNLGVLDWDRGDRAGAEREWTRALGPAPAYAPTLNDLGLVRENQKRYAEAIDFFEQAIRLRPKFMDPYKNLAQTYAEMGRPDAADRIFRQAVALAPLSMAARNSYGLFLIDQKRFAEAQEQFTRSAESDANSVAYDNLGDLLLRAGELDRARVAYGAALALNTFDNHADFGLAGIDERQGRAVEAIREYRAGLQTDPMNSSALAAVSRLAANTNAH